MKQFNELNFCVNRISCIDENNLGSSGTGFITAIHDNGETHNPIFVTNKHVIKGQKKIQICFNVKNEEGSIETLAFAHLELPSEENWFMHPDEKIDLCALPIGTYLNKFRNEGRDVVWRTIHPSWIPSKEQLLKLDSVEDVIMIGYPRGIWDEHNNRPIFRKGITATHPGIEFNGEKNFLIDIAAFNGSSGSPVFVYKEGFNVVNSIGTKLVNKDGKFFMIGILFAGPMFNTKGEIVVENIPTGNSYSVLSRIPMNLGYVMPSYILKDFEQIIPKPHKTATNSK